MDLDDGAFGDEFFASLAASPDDPESMYESGALDDVAGEGDLDFLYEAEGDGSFETEGEDFGAEDFDYDDFDYEDHYGHGSDDFDYGADDPDAEIAPEPDFDPDSDLRDEGDHEFGIGSDFGR